MKCLHERLLPKGRAKKTSVSLAAAVDDAELFPSLLRADDASNDAGGQWTSTNSWQ